MNGRILVVGDVMLDRELRGSAERLCPEQPVPVLDEEGVRSSPGGAGLAAALLARDGREVVLVTAIGRDDAGCELADLLAGQRVTVLNLGLDGTTPEKLRVRAEGSLVCRIDRGGGRPRPTAGGSAGRLVAEADAVLVSDYGGGLTSAPAIREALTAARTLVWDPHPRGSAPVPGTTVATPNEREARAAVGPGEATEVAQRLLGLWPTEAACLTLGARGAVLAARDTAPVTIPAEPVLGDPCGAGDRFAATIAALLSNDVPLTDGVRAACVEAAEFVAQGGWHGGSAHAPAVPGDDPVGLAERVRLRGGTVVATGGCFDLLHAGHVAMLQAARQLGDCLIVCLNSDASVRRLKGADRPLVCEDDRAAVLRALECVDSVVLFDEATPGEALRRLRPHVFVKGADYDVQSLPEVGVQAEHGGRVVTVPYVAGYSTSGLIERATTRAA